MLIPLTQLTYKGVLGEDQILSMEYLALEESGMNLTRGKKM